MHGASGQYIFDDGAFVSEPLTVTSTLSHYSRSLFSFLHREQVLLYQANSPSKSRNDVFFALKDFALKLTEKYKNDGSRISWVSIRLTEKFGDTHPNGTSVMLNSVYGKQEILSLVMTDLALRKIGLENLVMVASNTMSFKADFLNRVSV